MSLKEDSVIFQSADPRVLALYAEPWALQDLDIINWAITIINFH